MQFENRPFSELLSAVIDNRGKTCPTEDSGIPLIATNCVRNDLLYPTYESVRFVSEETYKTWFRGHPEPGDILFVNKATPGRVCLVPDPVDFCVAQDMVAVRANPKEIYPKYLFAALRSPLVQERIGQMHVGSLIPHFKKGDFNKLLLPVPDQPTQEAVGDIYFEISAKIDYNRRCNEALEAMARALFKDWFVDFGPVHAKLEGRDPYLSTDLWSLFPSEFDEGGLPTGWREGSIGDFARLNPESWSETHHPDDIAYVDLANTKWGIIESIARLSWEDAPSRARRVLQEGDTIVGTVRPGNGSFCLVGSPGLTASTGFAVLRPNSAELRQLIYLAATAPDNIERLSHLADGGAYPAVRPDAVSATPLVRPSSAIIDAFAETTSSLLDSVNNARHESSTLSTIRDTLLPKLLSGELRVRDAKRSASEPLG